MAIWRGPSFPSESIRKKTPMLLFVSESTKSVCYHNQLQCLQQRPRTCLQQNLQRCLRQCNSSSTENTQSGECRKWVSTSPSILVYISFANSATYSDGNATSGIAHQASNRCPFLKKTPIHCDYDLYDQVLSTSPCLHQSAYIRIHLSINA